MHGFSSHAPSFPTYKEFPLLGQISQRKHDSVVGRFYCIGNIQTMVRLKNWDGTGGLVQEMSYRSDKLFTRNCPREWSPVCILHPVRWLHDGINVNILCETECDGINVNILALIIRLIAQIQPILFPSMFKILRIA